MMNKQFGKDEEAVSPVIGVVLMVAITVIMAAVVFVLVGSLTEFDEETPNVQFTKQDGNLLVFKADEGLTWDDFTVQGCTKPTGTLDAGDTLTDCTGQVTISHAPTNTLVYSGAFQ